MSLLSTQDKNNNEKLRDIGENQMQKFIIKSESDEITEFFEMLVPDNVSKKEIDNAIDMAERYACFDCDGNPEEYDEFFDEIMELIELDENICGQELFNIYLSKKIGATITDIRYDYEYEW